MKVQVFIGLAVFTAFGIIAILTGSPEYAVITATGYVALASLS